MQLTLEPATVNCDDGQQLTIREYEVLRLVAEGKTDAEIAMQLFISRYTASNHVSRILSKLEVPNRTAASRWLSIQSEFSGSLHARGQRH